MPSSQKQPAKDAPGPRYREAAELAIEQLDWTINYLRRIDKPKIANALQHNRDAIVARARR